MSSHTIALHICSYLYCKICYQGVLVFTCKLHSVRPKTSIFAPIWDSSWGLWSSILGFPVVFQQKTRGVKNDRFFRPDLEAKLASKNLIYVARRAQEASGEGPGGIFLRDKIWAQHRRLLRSIFRWFWVYFEARPDSQNVSFAEANMKIWFLFSILS